MANGRSISGGCSAPLQPITNVAYVNYQYILDQSVPIEIVAGDTNDVVTDLACISTQKVANKTRVSIGEVVTYTINIQNNGTISVNNLIFLDTVPEGATFVENTFNVVGYGIVPGANPNYSVDLSTIVGVLPPGGECAVSFDVQLQYLPCIRELINRAEVIYDY